MKPMMAEGGHEPFDDPEWIFEPKLDGVRTLAYVSTDGTTLISRTGRDQTRAVPGAREPRRLRERACTPCSTGDRRARRERTTVVRTAPAAHQPHVGEPRSNGRDADLSRVDLRLRHPVARRPRPHAASRSPNAARSSKRSSPRPGRSACTLSVEGDGTSFFEAAKELGIEGHHREEARQRLRAREAARGYWRKIKAMRTLDAVVLGWTPGRRLASRHLRRPAPRRSRDGEARVGRTGRRRLHAAGSSPTCSSASTSDRGPRAPDRRSRARR